MELNIEIKDGRFCTSVYDKRDDFPFEIVQYPSANSNIPDKILINVFVSQTVRYLRVCNSIEPLKQRIEMLATKIKGKGARVGQIKQGLQKCIQKHQDLVKVKFDMDAKTFILYISL